MTERERLIDILLDGVTFTDEYKQPARMQAEYMADRLLANGVIVPQNIEVGGLPAGMVAEMWRDKIYSVGDALKPIHDDFTGGSKVWLDTELFKEAYNVICMAAHLIDFVDELSERSTP